MKLTSISQSEPSTGSIVEELVKIEETENVSCEEETGDEKDATRAEPANEEWGEEASRCEEGIDDCLARHSSELKRDFQTRSIQPSLRSSTVLVD